MNTKKIICQIIERILMYKEDEIKIDKFLDDTLGLFSIIENDSSQNFKKDFHSFWDIIEEYFATETHDNYQKNIMEEILPGFLESMKKYI